MANLRNRKGKSGTNDLKTQSTQDAWAHPPKQTGSTTWRLFSSNPDKAWTEKFYLLYSAVWPLGFAAWCKSGYHLSVGDAGNLLMTFVLAAPNVLVPMFWNPHKLPVHDSYWFKFGVWMGIFIFIGSYFWTEYFFDILGMKYNFGHLKWNLDSILLGSGRQVVPIMMYIHGWYFFITYHTCSVIFIRAIVTSPLTRIVPRFLLRATTVTLAAVLFAWGEIYATTMEEIRDQFEYADMDFALTWGALLYSCYFISSFPIVFHLDEEVAGPRWSFERVCYTALAAGMIGTILLDLAVQFIIKDWKSHDHTHQG